MFNWIFFVAHAFLFGLSSSVHLVDFVAQAYYCVVILFIYYCVACNLSSTVAEAKQHQNGKLGVLRPLETATSVCCY
jgi:hypothetical protein